MPKEAIARGAAAKVQPLARMARDITTHGQRIEQRSVIR